MFDDRDICVRNEENLVRWGEIDLHWVRDAIKGFPNEVSHERISKVWGMKQKYIKRDKYEKAVR